jgi:arylsulfatase A-like enzyme
MHAVDWVPTLASVAGYSPSPRVPGIYLDGVDHWQSLINNGSSPRTSVILDIEKPQIIQRWGDVGAGVVRKGDYKLHIGDTGQLVRPGDWSPPDGYDNITETEPTPFCTREDLNTSNNCAPYQLFDVIHDPSERHDLYGQPGYETIIAELKAMYEEERKVAKYPCTRGPTGHANKEGVLQPWLSPNDKCESSQPVE